MQSIIGTEEHVDSINGSYPVPVGQFEQLLIASGIEYQPAGYYWKVGEVTEWPTWVLYLSAIKTEVPRLIERVVPFLIGKRIPFKILRNQEYVHHNLEGNLGYSELGKIVCIYPISFNIDELTQQLIDLVQQFKGPAIPSATLIKGVLHACYEVAEQDYNAVPFLLAKNVNWPFKRFVTTPNRNQSALLDRKYYVLQTLKRDVKGDVMKALYFKRPWQIKTCIIKQGRKHTFLDEAGRDARERIKWQFELGKKVAGIIPTPDIFDHFEEGEDHYLAMQYFKGQTIGAWINGLYSNRLWNNLPANTRQLLIEKLIDIISVIHNLHLNGWIHRDITPANFLIDKTGKLSLIDMELAWSWRERLPDPPYKMGTPGYISPQQVRFEIPVPADDTYSMGALMIHFFTNLPPNKFDTQDQILLVDNLSFFLPCRELCEIIADCFSDEPSLRPTIPSIISALNQFSKTQNAKLPMSARKDIVTLAEASCPKLIEHAINGLASEIYMPEKRLWASLTDDRQVLKGNRGMEIAYFPGWSKGITGTLYLLSIAYMAGFDISLCKKAVKEGWIYIDNHLSRLKEGIQIGLLNGLSGMAVAVTAGKVSKLLLNDGTFKNVWEGGYLESCFSSKTNSLDFAEGISGQGLGLLHCYIFLRESWMKTRLTEFEEIVIDRQLPDGSWYLPSGQYAGRDTVTGIELGVAGCLLFLLANYEQFRSTRARAAIEKGLDWLLRMCHKSKNQISWGMTNKSPAVDQWTILRGAPGIILTLIKGYAITQENAYKNIIIKWLSSVPVDLNRGNLTFASGMAAIGELYLEAAQALNVDKYFEKAAFIQQALTHQFKKLDATSGYWVTDNVETPTADLFYGTSGIIHFLLRLNSKGKISSLLYPTS